MPPQKAQAAPDFIPAETPDFIPDQSVHQPNFGASTETPAPQDTISPRPAGIVPWFEDLEADLRSGGGRTFVGRGLGWMQGRGEKGYGGLEAGVSPAAADLMGSPELGAARALRGGAEMWTGHPLTGLGHGLQGVTQMATIPSAFVAPEAGAAGEDIPSLFGIPTRGHAARALEDITAQAKNVPVDLKNTYPAIDEFREFTRTGGRNPARNPVTKLAARTNPLTERQLIDTALRGPVNFPEARKFYTNVSQASARPGFLRRAIEAPGMPQTRQAIGNVREALNTDLTNAAGTIGRGQDYQDALREYARAMQIRDTLRKAGIAAAPAVAGYVGRDKIYNFLSSALGR